MQPPEKHNLPQFFGALSRYPKGHMAAAGALVVVLSVWASGSFEAPSQPAPSGDVRTVLTLAPPKSIAKPSSELASTAALTELPAPPATLTNPITTAATDPLTVEPPAEVKPEPTLLKTSLTVRSGDSLSALFKRAGLNDSHVYELTNTCKEAKVLIRIMPGHEIVFYLNGAGKLQKLRHINNRLSSTQFEHAEKGFVITQEIKELRVGSAYNV